MSAISNPSVPCLICGHQTTSFRHPRFDLLFHECPSCEVIFKDQTHHITMDAERKVYDLHQNDINNQGYVTYLTDFIEKAIVPFQPKDHIHALDFGSGPGPVLAHIMSETYHFQVDLYDPFYAPKKVFESSMYDVITCTEVIEHIKDPHQTFELFKHHLKPHGVLAMMTLFHPKNHLAFFEWFYIRDPSHIVFYTPKAMEILSSQHGLIMLWHDNKRIMTFKHQ